MQSLSTERATIRGQTKTLSSKDLTLLDTDLALTERRMRLGAFERLELLVVVDLYRSATAGLAHYVLPATDMFERRDITISGLGLQHRPYVQYTEAVVPPRDERREEWWILGRLEQALGLKSVLDAGPEPPLFSRVDHMLATTGLSVEKLRESPAGVAVLPPLDPGRFYDDWIQTADRRVDCCPPAFAETGALERAEEIFRELEHEPRGVLAGTPPGESARYLKLISLREPQMHNSWYQNIERLRKGPHGQSPLHIHPDDASPLGLAETERARVSSETGTIEVVIELDESLMPGVVAMAHGGGNRGSTGLEVAARHPGVNPNELLPAGPGSFEPLSNQAFMTGIPVAVEPALPRRTRAEPHASGRSPLRTTA